MESKVKIHLFFFCPNDAGVEGFFDLLLTG